MGVLRLTKYIYDDVDNGILRRDLCRSLGSELAGAPAGKPVLAVDAMNFVYTYVEQFAESIKGRSVSVVELLAGDLTECINYVALVVETWAQLFKLHFVWDGLAMGKIPQLQFDCKARTRSDRSRQYWRDALNSRRLANSATALVPDDFGTTYDDDTTIPYVTGMILQRSDVRNTIVMGEADDILGSLVRSGEAWAVLSNDTDMAIACLRWIPLQSIPMRANGRLIIRARAVEGARGLREHASVVRRELVARRIHRDLQEHELPAVAMLAGCDYSKGLLAALNVPFLLTGQADMQVREGRTMPPPAWHPIRAAEAYISLRNSAPAPVTTAAEALQVVKTYLHEAVGRWEAARDPRGPVGPDTAEILHKEVTDCIQVAANEYCANAKDDDTRYMHHWAGADAEDALTTQYPHASLPAVRKLTRALDAHPALDSALREALNIALNGAWEAEWLTPLVVEAVMGQNATDTCYELGAVLCRPLAAAVAVGLRVTPRLTERYGNHGVEMRHSRAEGVDREFVGVEPLAAALERKKVLVPVQRAIALAQGIAQVPFRAAESDGWVPGLSRGEAEILDQFHDTLDAPLFMAAIGPGPVDIHGGGKLPAAAATGMLAIHHIVLHSMLILSQGAPADDAAESRTSKPGDASAAAPAAEGAEDVAVADLDDADDAAVAEAAGRRAASMGGSAYPFVGMPPVTVSPEAGAQHCITAAEMDALLAMVVLRLIVPAERGAQLLKRRVGLPEGRFMTPARAVAMHWIFMDVYSMMTSLFGAKLVTEGSADVPGAMATYAPPLQKVMDPRLLERLLNLASGPAQAQPLAEFAPASAALCGYMNNVSRAAALEWLKVRRSLRQYLRGRVGDRMFDQWSG